MSVDEPNGHKPDGYTVTHGAHGALAHTHIKDA
jgi:hypothetical protein